MFQAPERALAGFIVCEIYLTLTICTAVCRGSVARPGQKGDRIDWLLIRERYADC